MWNLRNGAVVVSYAFYPFKKCKLTLLDHAPKRRVLGFMKKFVPHTIRHFILSVRVTIVQRMYDERLSFKENSDNLYLVAQIPPGLISNAILRLLKPFRPSIV